MNIMYWSSKSLPWLLPAIFLATRRGSPLILVSPWIEDIHLRVHSWRDLGFSDEHVLLSTFLQTLWLKYHIHPYLFVREDQIRPSMDRRLYQLTQRIGSHIELIGISNLHGKMVVTDSLILRTSANLLKRSLYTNVETVALIPNPFKDAMSYVRDYFARFGLAVPGLI